MRRTAGAVLAAAGALLLCGRALSEEKVRLPRKGSSPGFELRLDEKRHVPRHGNDAGPSWEDRERWARRDREERREREARREQEERRDRQALLERLERLQLQERREREERREKEERRERQARLERQERQAADCRRAADRAQQGQEEAKKKVVIGYIAGGLLGALVTSSQNDEAYKDPKLVRDQAYNTCMGQGQRDRRGQAQDNRDDDNDDDD
jgi:hypothetical protein